MRSYVTGNRFVKEADSPAECQALACEAELLRAVAHPGVVRALPGDPVGTHQLVLVAVTAACLAELPPQPAAVTAGWAAAVATTLADLHEIGFCHGAVTPEHIIFDSSGRPVLCGFGAAARSGPSALTSADDDVTALARLVSERLPASIDRSLARMLSRAAGAGGRSRRRPSARMLAAALARVPGARLPSPEELAGRAEGPAQPEGPPGRTPPDTTKPAEGRSWARVTAALAGAAAAGLLAFAAVGSLGPAAHPSAPAALASQQLPGPAGTYRLVFRPSERLVTVIGRWACGPDRPAALDLASGAVWTFGSWPRPGMPLRGRLVALKPGSVALAVEEVKAGCDALLTVTRSGRAVPLRVGAP